MSDVDRQILSGILREPRHREVITRWLGEKIEASTAALRESVRQGKWKDAAMSEGSLRAHEDLLSELTRI